MDHGSPSCLRLTNATQDDLTRWSPADEIMPDPAERWVRCINIEAPPADVYRWLCQLTVAPYSIDWIDNSGRRSPRRLTPGADQLALGQHFLIFAITSFTPGRAIAGRSRGRFRRVYGDVAVSYEALPREGSAGTRLQATACLARSTGPIRRTALAAGDKLMAGRQLTNIKQLAETSIRRHVNPAK